MRKSKMVIIMRSDLKNAEGHKVRTGKLIAQGSHAVLRAVLDYGVNVGNGLLIDLQSDSAITNWIEGSSTKVCLRVDSEEALMEIYDKALGDGLPCSLIIDAGFTEFNGVPTKTCCAIGPAWADEIDRITGGLKLL